MQIKIKTKENKKIYCDLNKVKKSEKLIIFMSGLNGGRGYSLFNNATNVFSKHSFDILTFNFYEKNKRGTYRQEDITFDIYANELKTVINYFNKKYEKIILIGHSFGAITSILFLNKYKDFRNSVDLVFWEPSYLPWSEKDMKADFIFDSERKLYYCQQTKEVMNPTFYDECIHTKNTDAIFKTINKSALIIAAKGSQDKDSEKYYNKLSEINKTKSSLIILDKTNHFFNGKGVKEVLFKKTLEFFLI